MRGVAELGEFKLFFPECCVTLRWEFEIGLSNQKLKSPAQKVPSKNLWRTEVHARGQLSFLSIQLDNILHARSIPYTYRLEI
jgi:hypothetical protein